MSEPILLVLLVRGTREALKAMAGKLDEEIAPGVKLLGFGSDQACLEPWMDRARAEIEEEGRQADD